MPELIAGFAIAFAITMFTTPVGISGAVFLVPAQLNILGNTSQAVTSTNLLFNIVAIPGALLRYRRDGTVWNDLTRLMVLGTTPGVIAGTILRVELFSSPGAFLVIVALVIGPLGIWMLLGRRPVEARERPGRPGPVVALLAFLVGVVGGIYGIGGGSILAPILIGSGFAFAKVAPAALASTFVTSLVGVATFLLLGVGSGEEFLPNWSLGVAMGLGGLGGGYIGAHLQARFSEALLRRLLGLLALSIAVYYLVG